MPAQATPHTGRVHIAMARCSRVFSDGLLVGALGLAAAFFAATYTATWEGQAQFLQPHLGPAVMLALGHGFLQPVPADAPAIMEFLQGDRQYLRRADVPEAVRGESAGHTYAREHLYFSYTLAALWRVFGIHWGVMVGLYGLAYAVCVMAAYGLLRQVSGRLLSTAGATMILLSPGYLFILPHFRDFSKAPFILLILLCLAALVRGPQPRRVQFALAGLVGLLAGIGLGFRQDLAIVFPGALLAVALFWPAAPGVTKQAPVPRGLRDRLTGVSVAVAVFAVAAYPIYSHEREAGSQSLHRLVGGLAAPIGHDMGIGGAPYEQLPLFLDDFIWATIAAHHLARNPEGEAAPYRSPAYDRAGLRYFFDYARIFPGDVATRWLGACRRVLNHEAFSTDSGYKVGYPRSGPFWMLHHRRMVLARWLGGRGVLLAGILLAVWCCWRPRQGWAVAYVLFFFTGYTSLQWHERHSFHMEIACWWVLAAILHGACRSVLWLSRNPWRGPLLAVASRGPHLLRTPLLNVGLPLLVMVVAFWAARAVQYVQVGHLYSRYSNATATPLATRAEDADGMLLLRVDGFLARGDATPQEKRHTVQPGMLLAEIEKQTMPFDVYMAFDAARAHLDHGAPVHIPPLRPGEAETVRLYYPVYNATQMNGDVPRRRFAGLKVARENVPAIRGLFAVENSQAFPFRMPLLADGDLGSQPRYKRFMPNYVPKEAREYLAAGRNLLPNGGCETWDADTGLPLGAINHSNAIAIQREPNETRGGDSAVRLSWQGHPMAPPLSRFSWFLESPEEGSYAFSVDVKNPVGMMAVIEAYLVYEAQAGGGKPAFRLLGRGALPPSTDFRTFSLSFYVPATSGKTTLLLSPIVSGEPAGAMVLDGLRLSKDPYVSTESFY